MRLFDDHRFSRRTVVRALAAAAMPSMAHMSAAAQATAPRYSYPMGLPGQAFGDGLFIRIAYAAENARYYPGWWHTGENWHALSEQTAGLPVYAVAEGEVVFAGSDYPGRVVIVRHPDGLLSMYGHLSYEVEVAPGDTIARGQQLGTVLARGDDLARSHLHFELRDFLIREEVNGTAPQYGVTCGYECPPGPGYWPITAPEHPSHLGWRNPTHVISRRAWPDGVPLGTEAIVAEGAPASVPLWTSPSDTPGAALLGNLALAPGAGLPLLAIFTGDEAATGTTAEATRLWYQLALPDGTEGWVQAAIPSDHDTGADGRPSSLRFILLPAVVGD